MRERERGGGEERGTGLIKQTNKQRDIEIDRELQKDTGKYR